MPALAVDEKTYAGLARGLRAAVVLPPLFATALLIVGEPVMAGFAVFGTFAHLVMVNYSAPRTVRAVESATLTVLGAIVVSLGTLASINAWSAVAGGAIAGFLAQSRWVAGGRIAVICPALLMAFMLAVAVSTPLTSLPPQLCGWLLAGLLAQPALQLLWIPIQPVDAARASSPAQAPANPTTASGNAIAAGAAMGLAVLTAHLLRLDHAFWIVLGVAPMLSPWNTSPLRTFWRQQAGTLLGFLAGAALATGAGAHQQWYWIALPATVFLAAYLSSAVGFIAGQAGFTAFAVVLFCILTPLQSSAGILRVEDIAIGGAISLLVGFLQRVGSDEKRSSTPSRGENPRHLSCQGQIKAPPEHHAGSGV